MPSNETKKKLALSLQQLLSKKTLNHITIQNITETCGVNRQTFYYHFKDIYDLLEWLFHLETERALSGMDPTQTWQQGFSQLLQYACENKTFVYNVYHSLGREPLERYLYHVIENLLMGVLSHLSHDLNVSQSDKQFIADFYKYAFVGLMLEWIRGNMKEAPDQIIARLSRMITGDLRRALLRLQQPPLPAEQPTGSIDAHPPSTDTIQL